MLNLIIRAIVGLCIALVLSQAAQWPIHDNGLNDIVQWDHYSLKIRGERILIWSGEFHYWRIPVPNVWRDLMQKIKAGGFNTVALYGNWYWHNPSLGTLAFEDGAHNPEPLFEIAKEVGLWVIFRPGPYINAETNAGGFPGWVTTGAYGSLRDNDTRYTEAWTPYFAAMSRLVSKHLVTNGGNVILYQLENEFASQFSDAVKKTPNYPSIEYMENLEQVARENGIDVPLFTNAPNPNGRSWSKDYSSVGGEQDIYGLDSYPQCWSCDKSECEQFGVISTFSVNDYASHFELVSPTQPSFLPEFQGGSYNPWGGPQGGCRNESSVDFVNVFYRDNISQRVTLNSLYMLYGGTNWGGLACPVVATSYDYSAPIQEDRTVAEKFLETKLVGLQLQAIPDLSKTDKLGNSTSYSTNPFIFTTELRNPDTNSAFYFVRHQPSNRTQVDDYKLKVKTSLGDLEIPQALESMTLTGKEAKILATDYRIDDRRSVIYSTAEILAYSSATIRAPLLVVWTPTNGKGEMLLKGVETANVLRGSATVSKREGDTTLVTFQQGAMTSTLIQFEDGLRILNVDRQMAYRLWAPNLSSSPLSPSNQTVIIIGPYLVRGVKSCGSVLEISGDIDEETKMEVFAPPQVEELKWNGRSVHCQKNAHGSISGTVVPRLQGKIQVEDIGSWKAQDGLPERQSSYDDSRWMNADMMNTSSPYPPQTLPVLYAEEYGIYWGPVLWRGRFAAGSSASGVLLNVTGGNAMGYSVYLNGDFIGSWRGARYNSTVPQTFGFSNATISQTTENVLLVIQDHTGKDLRDGALIPRGISNATLIGTGTDKFTSWKVAGAAGHKKDGMDLVDPVRGPVGEGGLHAERLGWHLPGFDDSGWDSSDGPSSGIDTDGIAFYRGTVSTRVAKGADAGFALQISNVGASRDFRVQVYVNGYQYGRYFSRIGNQVEFPVPPGILDYSGKPNTIGVNLWAQDAAGAKIDVKLKTLKVWESSFDPSANTEDLRPRWTDRSAYY